MDVKVPYGDIQGDMKTEFLAEAQRRHTKPIPVVTPETVFWYCGSCGEDFPVEDVLIEDTTPFCPRCDEGSGWETVRPAQST